MCDLGMVMLIVLDVLMPIYLKENARCPLGWWDLGQAKPDFSASVSEIAHASSARGG